ncbi:Dnaj protein-like protein [Thalictrum thalictroides]|uniref:Dnaj protein-like protein n=1 Tax=Thalictrum thalictroides TaxID=46969 RepID=A0A7J6VWA0_THATH|nr:Dnaj protein-like protein [Thalictrum thalictroides]
MYDQYGEDAVKDLISEIISPFSGSNDDCSSIEGRRKKWRRKWQGEDLVHYLKVSLEDLCNGISKKFLVSRNILCSNCNGKGTKSDASMECHACEGSGMKVSERQIGPCMIQQSQHCCNECKGTGEFISDDDRCVSCNGGKVVVMEKKVLEVHVEKGMQIGQKIIFPGEADESPNTITGDIVFVLQQKDHPQS